MSKNAFEKLEPEATAFDYEYAPALSQAISLKRIADTLDKIEARFEEWTAENWRLRG